MFFEFLRLAGQSIVHRRLRSWLTVIGVFIGIAAVVGLISLGLGFEKTVNDQVSQIFGVDTFIVVNENAFGPGGGHRGSSEEYALDLELLNSIEGIKVAAALREHNGFIEGGIDDEGKRIQGIFPVLGLSPELLTDFESFTGELEVMPGGRLFVPGDVEVTVLDQAVSQRLGVGVGDTIFVAGDEGAELNLTVIGIMAPQEEEDDSEGGFGAQFSSSSDGDTISVPFETMELLWGPADDVLVTLVRAEPGFDVDEVADRAEEELKKQGSEIAAVTYGDISEQIGQFTDIANAVLAGIAGISLVVGAVGVMNTMFTSVLERTKEIGVMKAVGAKNSHVLSIFLIESGLMGLVGGMVGSAAGIGLAVGFTALINRGGVFMGGMDMAIVISPLLLLYTLTGSFGLGALAGFFPARRASKLPVVDALRYE